MLYDTKIHLLILKIRFFTIWLWKSEQEYFMNPNRKNTSPFISVMFGMPKLFEGIMKVFQMNILVGIHHTWGKSMQFFLSIILIFFFFNVKLLIYLKIQCVNSVKNSRNFRNFFFLISAVKISSYAIRYRSCA